MQTYCYVIKPVTDRDEKAIRNVIVGQQIHAKVARLKGKDGMAFLEVVVPDKNEMDRIINLSAMISGRRLAYTEWRPQ
jgi:hypothetical protein